MINQPPKTKFHSLIIIGSETLACGLIMLLDHSYFSDNTKRPVMHFVYGLGGPEWTGTLCVIGLLALLIGIIRIDRIKHVRIDIIMISLLGSLWLAYTVTFVIQDYYGPKEVIDLKAVMSLFVFVQILHSAYYDFNISNQGDGHDWTIR